MNKKDIINALGKSLDKKVGDVKDEWKAPSVVVGENDGTLFVQTRAPSKQVAIDLRDKVKKALSGKYVVAQGIIEFDGFSRFWQSMIINPKK